MIVHSRICILCGLSPAQNRSVPPLRYDVTHCLVRRFPEMKFILNGGVRSYEEIDRHLGLVSQREGKEEEGGRREDEGGEEMPMEAHCQCSQQESLRQESLSPPSLPSTSFFTQENYPPLSPFSQPLPSCEDQSCLLWSATATSAPVHGVMIGREAYHNPWILADVDRRYYHTPNPGLSRREVLEEYLKYCDRSQERGDFKALTPVLCRPLHNYFHGHPRNGLYKRQFDELIKEYTSTRRQCRDVPVGEIVWRAMEGVIGDEYLDERMTSDGVMRRQERG
jgi:tRNA-dihydrouridine synthase